MLWQELLYIEEAVAYIAIFGFVCSTNVVKLNEISILGMFFNCLNAFWFYKIIKKVKRKLSGAEKWKAKNHVKEN